jgi:hypothetical protein
MLSGILDLEEHLGLGRRQCLMVLCIGLHNKGKKCSSALGSLLKLKLACLVHVQHLDS